MDEINCSKLLNQVIGFYAHSFAEDKRGYEFLNKHGINDNSVINRFKIGFSNGSIYKTIPKTGEVIDILKKAGILDKGQREYFKDYVVFPVFNQSKGVSQVYGKSIHQTSNIKHLTSNSSGLSIFNWEIAYYEDMLLLPEDIIDCLRLYQSGFKNAVFFSRLSAEDLKLLSEHNIREMVFLRRGEKASEGIEGMRRRFKGDEKLKRQLKAVGVKSFTAIIPNGLDVLGSEDIEKAINDARNKAKKPEVKAADAVQPPDITDIEDGFEVRFNRRKYELRGISKPTPRNLKANAKVLINNPANTLNPRFYIDTLDLYHARARSAFVNGVSAFFEEEPEIIEKDVSRLINLSEDYIRQKKDCKETKGYVMTDAEKAEALRILKSRNLVRIILSDMETLGFAGEEMNKLMGYLCCVSRKMEEPLSIMVISRSGAGKSSLADVATLLIPPEDLIKYTKLTGQALFYKDKESLKHKVLFIEEEKGAEDAAYSIRTMQSAKVLTVATTYRDTGTGKLRTSEYEVQGPLSVILTTTRTDMDYDMMSRFITLSIDESNEQTRRIQEVQRRGETLEGMNDALFRQSLIKKHQNIQRLLEPVKVINPYAPHLTFIDDRLRARRDHKKYLNLIKSIAFLYQCQRTVKEATAKGTNESFRYIEVTLSDINLANQLAHDVLGKSLDELTQPSRELLLLIYQMVREKSQDEKIPTGDFVFTRRQIREYTHWSHYQVSKHIRELEEKEYLMPRRPGMDMTKRYRLLYSGEGLDGSKFMPGLVNMEVLKQLAGANKDE